MQPGELVGGCYLELYREQLRIAVTRQPTSFHRTSLDSRASWRHPCELQHLISRENDNPGRASRMFSAALATPASPGSMPHSLTHIQSGSVARRPIGCRAHSDAYRGKGRLSSNAVSSKQAQSVYLFVMPHQQNARHDGQRQARRSLIFRQVSSRPPSSGRPKTAGQQK